MLNNIFRRPQLLSHRWHVLYLVRPETGYGDEDFFCLEVYHFPVTPLKSLHFPHKTLCAKNS